ncbi:MAG: hypothetical protein ABI353_06845 [Isosphaeraceae bacterium]
MALNPENGNGGASVPTFELGLVMAGAISAGAYTAGVIDFLIEAIDAWEGERGQADCPMHRVMLKAMTGASAGGMTAAIAAGLLGERFEHVRTFPHPARADESNKLFDLWVNRIDIERLLGIDDLKPDNGFKGHVQSLLDSTVLKEIAEAAFQFPKGTEPVRRPYVADPMDVLVSVTNLRGVPYAIELQGVEETKHTMMLHADSMRFALTNQDVASTDGVLPLRPGQYQDESWTVLKQAALATGAFPVGLAPRPLKRSTLDFYNQRQWNIPGLYQTDGAYHCGEQRSIPPAWPVLIMAKGYIYNFMCVDGGVMDNEPMEAARRLLGIADPVGTGQARNADRALLMVDPFPDASPYDPEYAADATLFKTMPKLATSLVNQARFKPEELVLAASPDIFNHFLIAPRRVTPDGKLAEYAIACGSLGGFGGFLSRSFREHDFFLGRRNAQQSLRLHLALRVPNDVAERKARGEVVSAKDGGYNPLFEGWTGEMVRRHWIFESADGLTRRSGQGSDAPGPGEQVYLPILPLRGPAETSDLPVPAWPNYTPKELETLWGQVNNRARRVARMLVAEAIKTEALPRNAPGAPRRNLIQYGIHAVGRFSEGWVVRALFAGAWWYRGSDLVDFIVNDQVKNDFKKRGLFVENAAKNGSSQPEEAHTHG